MVNASNTLYLADEKMNIIEMDNINDIYDNFTEMCISINNRAYVPKNCSTYPWSYFSFDVKKLIPNGKILIGSLSIAMFLTNIIASNNYSLDRPWIQESKHHGLDSYD